jgi:hypothetical protein
LTPLGKDGRVARSDGSANITVATAYRHLLKSHSGRSLGMGIVVSRHSSENDAAPRNDAGVTVAACERPTGKTTKGGFTSEETYL